MMQDQKTEKDVACGKERLELAKKDFDKMMKEIRPFIKKRSTRIHSTSDGWIVTSEQNQQQVNK
jgi:hypothetical protein